MTQSQVYITFFVWSRCGTSTGGGIYEELFKSPSLSYHVVVGGGIIRMGGIMRMGGREGVTDLEMSTCTRCI